MKHSARRLTAVLALAAIALAGCTNHASLRRTQPPAAVKVATKAPPQPATVAASPTLAPDVVRAALVEHPLLTDVQMVSPSSGWAIEQLLHGTAVARTSDGGRNWTTVYVTPAPATALSAANMATVYVMLSSCANQSCSATELAVTHDGGVTWSIAYSGQGFNGAALSFVTSSIGYVGGTVVSTSGAQRGDLLVTGDGGQVWTDYALPCDTGSMALSFQSAADGWLLCGGPTGTDMQAKSLYRTLDGGAHWSLVTAVSLPQGPSPSSIAGSNSLPLSGLVRSMYFRSGQQGWIGLDRGGVFETTDAGSSWHAVWQPPFAPGADDAFSVGFTDPSHGWLLYGEGPPLSTTSDGGRTWTVVYPPLSPSAALSFGSSSTGIGAGWVYDGTLILSTSDAGVHWTMAARAPVQISGLAVVAPGSYVVLGQDALYRTEDGGATWAAALPPSGYYPAALGMRNADVGYLVAYKPGRGRSLFSTADGGSSWIAVPTPFSPSAVGVDTGGRTIAVGTAAQRAIWQRGWDGKLQEISLTPGTPYLWFAAGTGWWPVRVPHWKKGQPTPVGLVTGPNGLVWMWSQTTLWLSTNDGASWQTFSFGDRLAISDVSFTDALHGWLLAGRNVYSTTNGGRTWREISGSVTY